MWGWIVWGGGEGEAIYEIRGKGVVVSQVWWEDKVAVQRPSPAEHGGGRAAKSNLHSAKRASSERSCFFLLEGFVGGVGASRGGDGRLGTISAALARSSKNLSNSAMQKKKEDR